MMEITCCLIDDEPLFLEAFKIKLLEEFRCYEIACRLDSFSSAEQFDLKQRYDVYFLDIDMPKTNGFQLSKQIKQLYPNAIIIFVSSKENLVYESFEVHPFDFIVKSFIDTTLKRKVASLISILKPLTYHYSYKGVTVDIPVCSIMYVDKLLNYTQIHIKSANNQILSERKPIAQILSEISDMNIFIKISFAAYVNMNYIRSIEGKECILINNERLPISRSCLPAAKQKWYTFSK